MFNLYDLQHLATFDFLLTHRGGEFFDTDWILKPLTTSGVQHESSVELGIAKRTPSQIKLLPPMSLPEFKAILDGSVKILIAQGRRRKFCFAVAKTFDQSKAKLPCNIDELVKAVAESFNKMPNNNISNVFNTLLNYIIEYIKVNKSLNKSQINQTIILVTKHSKK